MIVKKIKRRITNANHQRKAFKHPLSVLGFVDLKSDELVLDENTLSPRNTVDGEVYSAFNSIEFELLPKAVLKVINHNWCKIEAALGGEAVLRSFYAYRNSHIPEKHRQNEVYSDAWHRDNIGVTNVQLFILLHQTDKRHGPFRYINSDNMNNVNKKYPALKDPKNRSINCNVDEQYVSYFEGSRGDYLLVSTFTNYHSATIPAVGYQRDMVSIAFEPKHLTDRTDTLTKTDIEQLINQG